MLPDLEYAHSPIRVALRGTGLKWYGWHAFRRGLATNLAELGIGPKVIQRVMRHSKLDVTYDHYIQARDEKVDEAMEKLNIAISSKIYHA